MEEAITCCSMITEQATSASLASLLILKVLQKVEASLQKLVCSIAMSIICLYSIFFKISLSLGEWERETLGCWNFTFREDVGIFESFVSECHFGR